MSNKRKKEMAEERTDYDQFLKEEQKHFLEKGMTEKADAIQKLINERIPKYLKNETESENKD